MHKLNSEEIKYFLTAARYLNFSKAAEKLYVSQPAITKWIKHLEKELDLTLFERTNKGIRLTAPGQYLYEKWSLLSDDFKDSIAAAQSLCPNSKKTIQIGILRGLDHDKYLLRGISRYQKLHPHISFHIQVYDFYEMKETANDLDLILITSLETNYLTDSESLITEKMNIYIAMSDQNPLSQKEELYLADMKDETFIIFAKETMSSAMYHLNEYYKPLGVAPHIVPVDNIPSQRIFVKLNQGIAITNHRFTHEDDGIVLKVCQDFTIDISRIIMFNKKSKNKTAAEFFRSLSEG
ncbi:MAG: LysR family transcriptional regulator [Lachnospiraceae bacterium]